MKTFRNHRRGATIPPSRHCEARSGAAIHAAGAARAPSSVLCLLSSVLCLLSSVSCLPSAQAAEDKEKTREVKEIRAGQAREKARGEEARRLMKQPANSLPERDPFEASSAITEGGGGSEPGKRRAFFRTPDDAVFRNLKLKALVRSENGGVAQLISGRDLITLYHDDEIALEGRRYKVAILADGVKFTEQLPESEQQETTEGEPPRKPHTGWVR
jgi:hypothetical protein